MKVAVITANYNNYEILKPVVPQKDVDVEWIYVSDHRPSDLLGWSIQQDVHWGKDPRLAAKFPKVRPWRYCSDECEYSIWIDASFKIVSETFVSDMVGLLIGSGNDLAQFPHPVRKCIYEEAAVVKRDKKYARNLPIEEQVAFYREEGHPENWGLWATGVMVRKHTLMMLELGNIWMNEISDWTTCDQISQPYVMNLIGVRPTPIPGQYHTKKNPWVEYDASPKHN